MNHYRRGLTLRFILAMLGFVLAWQSYSTMTGTKLRIPNLLTSNSNNDSDGWYNSYDDNSDSGWEWNGSDDNWNGGGDWDSGGGWDSSGDSGSWDDGGGDSGSW